MIRVNRKDSKCSVVCRMSVNAKRLPNTHLRLRTEVLATNACNTRHTKENRKGTGS
jgi:hypothetical protein